MTIPASLITISYLVAGVLFILSLGGLSAQSTARRGNAFGIVGMLLAVAITAVGHVGSFGLLSASQLQPGQPQVVQAARHGMVVIFA